MCSFKQHFTVHVNVHPISTWPYRSTSATSRKTTTRTSTWGLSASTGKYCTLQYITVLYCTVLHYCTGSVGYPALRSASSPSSLLADSTTRFYLLHHKIFSLKFEEIFLLNSYEIFSVCSARLPGLEMRASRPGAASRWTVTGCTLLVTS